MIAPPRSLNEVSLHDALGGGAADLAALGEYGEATPPDRSIFVRSTSGGSATIDAPIPPTAIPRLAVA